MKKVNLQIFSESGRNALLRNKIADYLDVNGKFELCGIGFTKLDESPGAQSDGTTYINETTSSSDIIGYESEFPYEFNAIPAQKALYTLWKDGRDHHTGADAQHVFLKVDLFNPIGEVSEEKAEFTARKFIVANEVSEFAGEGGQKITASGTLKAVGDLVNGKFDTVSMTFTEGEFKGKYDLMLEADADGDKDPAEDPAEDPGKQPGTDPGTGDNTDPGTGGSTGDNTGSETEPDTDSADKVYTQDELEAMTVDQIKTLAADKGYTISATLKADIITEFLQAQNGEDTP